MGEIISLGNEIISLGGSEIISLGGEIISLGGGEIISLGGEILNLYTISYMLIMLISR